MSWNMIRFVLLFLLAPGLLSVNAASEGMETAGVFENGQQFFGASAGVALGTQFFSNQRAHDLVMLHLYFGQVTSDEWSADRWYGGQWTIAGELGLGYQYRSDAAAVFGAGIISRYIFSTEGPWHPYFLAGVGANWTDMGEPDLGGKFQFSPQGGAGVYWFFHSDVAASLEYRFVHYSNGGLRTPNSGVNVNSFLVGVTFFH